MFGAQHLTFAPRLLLWPAHRRDCYHPRRFAPKTVVRPGFL